jgi:hypothetical protein
MASAKCSDQDFMEMFNGSGATSTAKRLNTSVRAVYARRSRIEGRKGQVLVSPIRRGGRGGAPNTENVRHSAGAAGVSIPLSAAAPQHHAKVKWEIDDGIVLVAADGHYWPGATSTAHRALVCACAGDLTGGEQPKAFIYNGDIFDGSSISRHPPIGWEDRPAVVNELLACQHALQEIEDNLPLRCKLAWTLGNHDMRYSTRLATQAPEYAKVNGTQLRDHFSERWTPAWAVFINDRVGGLVVKHRQKGGLHAPHNNTLWAGRSMATGHLHSQKVAPLTDYNGTRWGVDVGCIAYPYGPQFIHYTESNPLNWIAGFAVFTFRRGQLLPPELVTVWSHRRDEVTFRGKIIKVG